MRNLDFPYPEIPYPELPVVNPGGRLRESESDQGDLSEKKIFVTHAELTNAERTDGRTDVTVEIVM